MLKEVYGSECLSHTQVSEWFKRFTEGRETTQDDPHPGRHSTSKTDDNIRKIGPRRSDSQSTWWRRGSDCPLWTSEETICRRARPWMLYQDNATAHSALSVKAFFAKYGITVLDHPSTVLGRHGSPLWLSFIYFLRSNRSLRGRDLTVWKRWEQKRRTYSTSWRKRTSSTALNGGKLVWNVVGSGARRVRRRR